MTYDCALFAHKEYVVSQISATKGSQLRGKKKIFQNQIK